ncbi:hydroxyethylthiazole kinase [Brachybacterium sp. AOP25-B2-12]|uniref:hydroxyethylthiazole kinase n=1 Tax=Brachybacterium sp. AOP25-B2-12 TaxID=3457710 RepID=UPI004033B3E8
MAHSDAPSRWVELLARPRGTSPLVQCLTNTVVQQVTANALLAAGAAPAMVDHPDEVEAFAAVAQGVLVNLGTVAPHQVTAMPRAAAAARAADVPWVLDPVAVGALPVRTPLAHALVALAPAAVRGNASEILALAGAGAGGRGVDSAEGSEDAVTAARELAARTGGVVAVSGVRDLVVSAERATWIAGGDPLLTRVTGTGCALGALTAALLAVARTEEVSGDLDHDAVVAAHALVAAAGSRAAIDSAGPGSFAVAWLDALGTLDAADVAAAVDLEEI